MSGVGFVDSEDHGDERSNWERARRATFQYWRQKLGDDLREG